MKEQNNLKLKKLLKEIFEAEFIQKIFFAGSSELLWLHQDFQIKVENYLDVSTLI